MANVGGIDSNGRRALFALSNANDGTLVNLWADPITHRLLTDNAGSVSLVVGSTTITGGTDKGILYDNAGVVGEYTPSASLILATNASKNVVGLATATYPSLTELSYVKGVTSAIQTQLNTKGAGTVTAVSVATANGFSGSSSGGATPALTIVAGAITPTTVNGLTITANGTNTLSITAGKTLSVIKTMSFTASDDTGVYTLPTGTKTLVATDVATLSSLTSVGTITTGGLGTGATLGAVTVNISSSAVGDIYAATTSNVLSRIAAVATGQVLISKGTTTLPAWSASVTVSQLITTANTVTVTTNAGTVPITSYTNNFTNSSASAMTITMATTSAIDGQRSIVRIYDFTAVSKGITWVGTENSANTTIPPNSAGSTTIPLTVALIFNGATSKWTCVGFS